jgi:hypothetical protein
MGMSCQNEGLQFAEVGIGPGSQTNRPGGAVPAGLLLGGIIPFGRFCPTVNLSCR